VCLVSTGVNDYAVFALEQAIEVEIICGGDDEFEATKTEEQWKKLPIWPRECRWRHDGGGRSQCLIVSPYDALESVRFQALIFILEFIDSLINLLSELRLHARPALQIMPVDLNVISKDHPLLLFGSCCRRIRIAPCTHVLLAGQ
jgi:hypothetical protein